MKSVSIRELSATAPRELHRQCTDDIAAGAGHFVPATEPLLVKAHAAFAALPSAVFLRAIDGLHLVTAREAGFAEIYSNDRHLPATASRLGREGIHVIPAPQMRRRVSAQAS